MSENWEQAYRNTLAKLRVCEAEHARQAAVLRRIDARVIDMVEYEGMPFDLLYEIHEMINGETAMTENNWEQAYRNTLAQLKVCESVCVRQLETIEWVAARTEDVQRYAKQRKFAALSDSLHKIHERCKPWVREWPPADVH